MTEAPALGIVFVQAEPTAPTAALGRHRLPPCGRHHHRLLPPRRRHLRHRRRRPRRRLPRPKHARLTSFRCQHPGRALRPVPAGAWETAAAPAQDRMASASRTRLAPHARTPRSRAPLTSTRFPPTRPGVVRLVRARPGGPTRLRQDAAVLAVRPQAQSWPMIAAHTARIPQALDARPL